MPAAPAKPVAEKDTPAASEEALGHRSAWPGWCWRYRRLPILPALCQPRQ
ncbi:hypothetical protein NMB32_16415 [Stenotrophomonas sp. CD2]|nr:hypothetical protein NMB32_16415 [Stenotrophomonas sp. CD2]